MINDKTLERIEEKINASAFRTNNGFYFDGTFVITRSGHCVCRVAELTEAIADLKKIQEILEEETGVRF